MSILKNYNAVVFSCSISSAMHKDEKGSAHAILQGESQVIVWNWQAKKRTVIGRYSIH